ncbi:MAG: hypothetical protein KGY66_04210 [Candidatus Thermoplasmatota archaeon]|nr:hypothetical protein [Candidatus Thermoplasmatota archaeon]MBS3790101.1 hypothetical protein [Candidatus Thermoplasmatota archaeon]
MVIVDNNILSSLAKAEALELLEKCFEKVQTTPEVIHEFRDESIIGFNFVQRIEDVKTYSKTTNRWLVIISLNREENKLKDKLAEEETGISHTDAECLSVALERDEILLTDDSKMGEIAIDKGIDVYDLETILLMSAKKRIVSDKEEGKKVIEKIEKKDYYIFSGSFLDNFLSELEDS